MFTKKITGRFAPSLKYDLLTALGCYALAQDKHRQRLVLRLITLITARYNWSRDQLSIGQDDIADLWSVDVRTVKREMAKLRDLNWLDLDRQGARGHVSQYKLGLTAILEMTQPFWARVGVDLESRLQTPQPKPVETMPVNAAPERAGDTEWDFAQAALHALDQAKYAAWIQPLTRKGRVGGIVQLTAPTQFHATYTMTHFHQTLLGACKAIDPDVRDVVIGI